MRSKLMMKKTIISVMLVICILVAGMGAGVYAEPIPKNYIIITVNGQVVDFPDAQPFIDNQNRTMVPVRFISEALGYEVDWNQATREVPISGNGKEIVLKQNSNKAVVDGKVVQFDTYVVAKQNRTFVPLRFVSETLGAVVKWEMKNNVNYIAVTTGEGVVSASTIEGFNSLTQADGAMMLDNMELIASLVPEDNILMDKDASGGRVMYNPAHKPVSISDALVIITSAVGNECDVIIKPRTWTVEGLEGNKNVIACVNYTRETLKTYLPKDWKVIFDAFDSRKTDRTKTYICDNRAVRIAGNEILIGFIGQKTIAGK